MRKILGTEFLAMKLLAMECEMGDTFKLPKDVLFSMASRTARYNVEAKQENMVC